MVLALPPGDDTLVQGDAPTFSIPIRPLLATVATGVIGLNVPSAAVVLQQYDNP
jgi:hypothetical protein